jgi:hypothetical protein
MHRLLGISIASPPDGTTVYASLGFTATCTYPLYTDMEARLVDSRNPMVAAPVRKDPTTGPDPHDEPVCTYTFNFTSQDLAPFAGNPVILLVSVKQDEGKRQDSHKTTVARAIQLTVSGSTIAMKKKKRKKRALSKQIKSP